MLKPLLFALMMVLQKVQAQLHEEFSLILAGPLEHPLPCGMERKREIVSFHFKNQSTLIPVHENSSLYQASYSEWNEIRPKGIAPEDSPGRLAIVRGSIDFLF